MLVDNDISEFSTYYMIDIFSLDIFNVIRLPLIRPAFGLGLQLAIGEEKNSRSVETAPQQNSTAEASKKTRIIFFTQI